MHPHFPEHLFSNSQVCIFLQTAVQCKTQSHQHILKGIFNIDKNAFSNFSTFTHKCGNLLKTRHFLPKGLQIAMLEQCYSSLNFKNPLKSGK